MKHLILLPALTAALSLAGLANSDNSTCSSTKTASWSGEKTILETAVAAGSFNTLAAALEAGDLIGALSGEGPFTVFAPTDDAFAALPKGTLESLLKPENKGLLQTILTYHVVPGRVPAASVVELKNATALNGQRIAIDATDGVQVAGVNVVKTDIKCSNGIIHVVDAVMMPKTKDIIETAVDAGSFKTLAAAIQAAGLVEALQGDGPFTVFAPTDDAFAALPEGTVETLLKPENKEKLTAVLTYHVVSGRIYSDQLENGAAAKTLQGNPVKVKLSDKGAFINDAQVVTADIETTNGVIHVINKVLLPQ